MSGPALFIKQLSIGPMENFCYLVGDRGKAECAVIDPAWDADEILRIADEEGMRVAAIMVTHTHFDHANAVEDLAKKLEVPVYVHQKEAKYLSGAGKFLRPVKDQQKIRIGDIEIECLHTPGHTPGGVCYLACGHLFSGDTLFVNACGRCDLPGSDAAAMYDSLQRLGNLAGDTRVYPGHDYGDKRVSTIKQEKEKNPYYQCRSRDDFLAFRG